MGLLYGDEGDTRGFDYGVYRDILAFGFRI